MNLGKTFFAYLYSWDSSKAESRKRGAKMAILCLTMTESVWARLSMDNKQWTKGKKRNPVYRKYFFIIQNLILPIAYRLPIIFGMAYSHSIVAGGLLLISYTTRLMPFTLLMISFEIFAKNSYGK